MSHKLVIAPKTKLNQECKKNRNGFYQKFGASISSFYIVDSYIKENNDSIGILKPFYTYPEYNNCYPESADKNLLIVYDIKKAETKVYDNILFSDDRNVVQELKPNKSGFIIYSEEGNSSKLFTNIFVAKNKIDSIQLESWGFDQFSKTYRFKSLYLDKFKVSLIDSLQEINAHR
jgi:hypothetical protein